MILFGKRRFTLSQQQSQEWEEIFFAMDSIVECRPTDVFDVPETSRFNDQRLTFANAEMLLTPLEVYSQPSIEVTVRMLDYLLAWLRAQSNIAERPFLISLGSEQSTGNI